MLVQLREHVVTGGRQGAKQFRYEDVWQTHADYDSIVMTNWQKGAGQQGLAGILGALNEMQSSLSAWGAWEFGSLTATVRKLRENLKRLRSQAAGRGPTD